MLVSDLIVEVRDANYNRLGQLLPEDLVGFETVLRKNNVGSWRCKLPTDHGLASALQTAGAGIIVTTTDGVLLSGPVTAVKTVQSTNDPVGTLEFTGVDDSVILLERLAYPDPAVSNVSAQTKAYDVRGGNAETVMKAYVNANIGPSASVARKISNLTIESDAARGQVVSGSARFDTLQELLSGLAEVAGLGFNIEQVEDQLVFKVYEPVDRSADVRMDLYNGRLTKTEYAYARPSVTHAIVAGQGDGVDRVFVETTTTDSLAAATVWHRRIEGFTDQRSIADNSGLVQAGEKLLSEKGKTLISTSITPSDDLTMQFGVDWGLGDKVAVVIDSVETTSVVSEVAIIVGSDGVRIGATLGPINALDVNSKIIGNQQVQESRISNLERNTSNMGVAIDYSPVWSGTGLTYTGTPAVGSYIRFGNLVHFRVRVSCATVTTFGTGQYYLTLPVEPVSDYVFRDGGIHANGSHYKCMADAEAGSLNISMWTDGSNGQDEGMDHNSPHTLTTSDYFYVSGTYQAQA